ncbi:eukaryotic mitochondrial regulator protein-domain-containing protein [Infundibulicybe gibba]|nr:eukaryotic mitochondrial regulator protein-domain-containing protein [Infundibulicybe gibba]
MLAHLRLASRPVRSCSRPLPRLECRKLSSSLLRQSSLAPEPPSEEPEPALEAIAEAPESQGGLGEEVTKPETYNEFIEAIGASFKNAQPRNWLGGEVPFPMNPSFRPPAPISDAQRSRIYAEFMMDPETNSVRALSQRYHLSLKRVDAILRLKGLENAWIKIFSFLYQEGKTIQTGFTQGMEKILGVKQDEDVRNSLANGQHDWTRYDVHEADTLEEEEKRDASRQRYQRLYWESVPEDGREPIVPASLEDAKKKARNFRKMDESLKSMPKVMPRIKDTDTIKTPRHKVQISTKPGRPTIRFVDVGGKFVDLDERLHRIARAERRSKIKEKKSVEKKSFGSERRAH